VQAEDGIRDRNVTGVQTCALPISYTSKDGGRVYLGHADGKVTVYSPADYSCLAVVNVSVYKINCLGIVGDYLWAAYKTGMIYVRSEERRVGKEGRGGGWESRREGR